MSKQFYFLLVLLSSMPIMTMGLLCETAEERDVLREHYALQEALSPQTSHKQYTIIKTLVKKSPDKTKVVISTVKDNKNNVLLNVVQAAMYRPEDTHYNPILCASAQTPGSPKKTSVMTEPQTLEYEDKKIKISASTLRFAEKYL